MAFDKQPHEEYQEQCEREIIEKMEENIEKGISKEEIKKVLEIPDKALAKEILEIDDPELREKQTTEALEFFERQEEIERQYREGEISDIEFWDTHRSNFRRP